MTDFKPCKARMVLRQIALSLHLGWTEKERATKQHIYADILLTFNTPPDACHSDALEDTFCYDALIKKMLQKIESRHFHLIEHVAETLYQEIRLLLPNMRFVHVKIKKDPHDYIPALLGGVEFSYGDKDDDI